MCSIKTNETKTVSIESNWKRDRYSMMVMMSSKSKHSFGSYGVICLLVFRWWLFHFVSTRWLLDGVGWFGLFDDVGQSQCDNEFFD